MNCVAHVHQTAVRIPKTPSRPAPVTHSFLIERGGSARGSENRCFKKGVRLAGEGAGENIRAIIGFAGRRTSESEAVQQHAEKDRGVAAAGRLANQDEKQTSARNPFSGEVSAARQTGAGKTSHTSNPEGARATRS